MCDRGIQADEMSDIAHHFDHHQLPLHHQQASLRHQLCGLQHLVCPCIPMEDLQCLTLFFSTAPTTAPVYANTSTPVATYPATSVGTVSPVSTAAGTPTPSTITTNGAGKAMAVSGAGLAGLLGLAAFLL
jgi:hypothetical protein